VEHSGLDATLKETTEATRWMEARTPGPGADTSQEVMEQQMPVSRICADLPPVTVALVNNMPDSAFIDTEHQFRDAMVGPPGARVALELYTITEIPRSEKIAQLIESRYRGLDELWSRPPDALIVTGTEPAQTQLRYEPYWPYLARLLEWAADSVTTTLLSCLAAHASLLLFDGIERVPRPLKCSGVFEGAVQQPRHPLAVGLPEAVRFPHSRVNDVPEAALVDAGYRIVVGSGSSPAGWAVATREHGDGLFVLCQGHPEYGTLSLLREYRRDVRRCLFGRGAVEYPRLPDGYLSPATVATLKEFELRARASHPDPLTLWASFPYDDVAAGVENTWAAPSATLYSNWLGLASAALPLAA
jgi:homoserine O-succinyltransferase